MIVLLFQKRFAALVASSQKRQTIRPLRKRPIKIGDPLSLRRWTGAPYRSKQIELTKAVCTDLAEFRIVETALGYDSFINGTRLSGNETKSVALADGFGSAGEMLEWFEATHGLPFIGTLIKW